MKASEMQIGGTHYKGVKIQPIEFIERNHLSFTEGMIIKYLFRAREKNGLEDVNKAAHSLALLIEMASDRKHNGDKLFPVMPKIALVDIYEFCEQKNLSFSEVCVINAVCTWRFGTPTRKIALLKKAMERLEETREVVARDLKNIEDSKHWWFGAFSFLKWLLSIDRPVPINHTIGESK